MFRLVAILLLITKHTFGQISSICAEVPNNNYVRSSQSCNSFNQCINGQPILGVCPKGFSFSPLTQMCYYSIGVDCRLCSPFGIQNIPEPDSCNMYYQCVNGVRTTMVCPNGLLFDRKVGDCNVAERVICETKNTICEPFASLGMIVIGNPMDCSSYYHCANGRAFESVCSNGLLYNPHIAICEPRGSTNFCQGLGPIITTPIPVPTTSEPVPTTSVRIVYMRSTTTVPVTESTTRASTMTDTTTATTTATTTIRTTITTSTSAGPSATEPPTTEPPTTEPPTTEGPSTEPPSTEPPSTEPPSVEPPSTEPPVIDTTTTESSATPAPPPILTCEAGKTGYFAFPPPDNCVRYYYCSRGTLRYQYTCVPPQFFTTGGDRCTDNVPPECEHLLPQIDDV